MFKLLGGVNRVLAVIGATLLLLISFAICYSVFTRAVGVKSPIWIIQFTEYAMLWVTFLAVAWVLARDKHVSIQIIMSRLGRRGKKALRLVQNVVCTLLCALLGYLGALTTWEHFRDNVIDVQTVDVPKAYVLVVIPFGFLLLFLQFIKRTIGNGRPERPEGREGRRPEEDQAATSVKGSSSAETGQD